MYVQPVATSRGGHGGRRLLLSVALPIVALVATAGAGWAGRLSQTDDPTAAVQPPAETVRPRATAAPPGISLPPPREIPPLGAPDRAFDLPVIGVVAALEAQRAGGIDGLVAVAGHFTVDPRPGECLEQAEEAVGGVGPLCRRSGLLASRPEYVLAVDHNGIAPEAVRLTVAVPLVNVRVRGGVALPAILGQATAGAGAVEPVPAVLVGRFNEPRSATCQPDTARCRGDFVLERVAWIAGEWYQAPFVVSATGAADVQPGTALAAIESRAVATSEPVLGVVLAPREALAWIDRGAADAVRTPPDGILAYARWAARSDPGAGPRHVGWTVVDPTTGAVLAEGISRNAFTR